MTVKWFASPLVRGVRHFDLWWQGTQVYSSFSSSSDSWPSSSGSDSPWFSSSSSKSSSSATSASSRESVCSYCESEKVLGSLSSSSWFPTSYSSPPSASSIGKGSFEPALALA